MVSKNKVIVTECPHPGHVPVAREKGLGCYCPCCVHEEAESGKAGAREHGRWLLCPCHPSASAVPRLSRHCGATRLAPQPPSSIFAAFLPSCSHFLSRFCLDLILLFRNHLSQEGDAQPRQEVRTAPEPLREAGDPRRTCLLACGLLPASSAVLSCPLSVVEPVACSGYFPLQLRSSPALDPTGSHAQLSRHLTT